MKSILSHSYSFVALVLLALLMGLSIPIDSALADANVPTETNTPAPTETSTPQPTDIPPAALPQASDTPIIFPTSTPGELDGEAAFATPLPPPDSGGLSTIDRLLLMILAVAVVVVIGVIVYLVYYQTRGGVGDR
jgi:hypothetical protein